VAAAVLLASCLSGCGSSSLKLKTGAIEHAIAHSIRVEHGLRATVRCPSAVPRKVGSVFTCTASLEVGTYPVLVTETNGRGHVRYQNLTPLITLDIATVERGITLSILHQRHLHSTVTCPTEVLQEAGVAFTCTAAVNGQSYPFSVTEVDNSGHVRYSEGQ